MVTMLGIEVASSLSAPAVCEKCLRTLGAAEKPEPILGKVVCPGCAPDYHKQLNDYFAWEHEERRKALLNSLAH